MSGLSTQRAEAGGPVADAAPIVALKDTSWLNRVRSAVLPPIVAGLLGLAVLEGVARSGWVPSVVWPSPFTVMSEMVSQAASTNMWEHLWITLQESLIGFAIGSAIGFSVGAAIGVSRLVLKAVYPYVVLIQSMPRVALAPVFIALLGFGMSSKVLTAVAICFFPPLINTMIGLANYESNSLELMKSMGATRFQIFRMLLLPGALPMIFGGLKTALTLAVIGAIVGELTAANAGMGMLIVTAAYQLRIPAVFGYVMWLSIVALVLFRGMDYIDRRIVFWKEDGISGPQH